MANAANFARMYKMSDGSLQLFPCFIVLDSQKSSSRQMYVGVVVF